MAQFIAITLTDEAARLMAGLQTFPARLATAMAAAMNVQNQATVGHIQTRRLSPRWPASDAASLVMPSIRSPSETIA